MDQWISDKLQYSDALEFLTKVKQENLSVISELENYFSSIRQRFTEITNEPQTPLEGVPTAGGPGFRAPLDLLHVIPLPGRRPLSPVPKDPSQFITVSDRACAPFKFAHRTVQRMMDALASFRTDYTGKMDNVCSNFKAALESLDDANTRFQVAYRKYKQAADKLKSAADAQAPNLAELKASFLASQQKAVEGKVHLDEVTLQTALKVEGSLNSYEDVEQWRTEQIHKLLSLTADWCDEFAQHVQESSTTFHALGRHIPDEQELNDLFDFETFPDPGADDKFQVLRIDSRATLFLDPSTIFIQEQKRNGVLYRVTKDCTAHGPYMAAVTNEIVCVMEERKDDVFAININDAKGLIPKSSVTRHRP